MKGKGKAILDKDCPLQFPDLQPVDHTTECPKYTAGNKAKKKYLCFLLHVK